MLFRFNVVVGSDKTITRWNGESLPTLTDVAHLHFEDGRPPLETKVEPYLVERKLPPNVEIMWTKEELLAYGLLRVIPAVPPEGKQFVGEPRYVRDGDVVREMCEVEDVPPPPTTVTISVDEHQRLVTDAEKWRLRDVELVRSVEFKEAVAKAVEEQTAVREETVDAAPVSATKE